MSTTPNGDRDGDIQHEVLNCYFYLWVILASKNHVSVCLLYQAGDCNPRGCIIDENGYR